MKKLRDLASRIKRSANAREGTVNIVEQIKADIQRAEATKQKIAMFHFKVLKNADELKGLNPEGFCKEVGMSQKYATEFRKMLALARLMKEQGAKLISN
jgi:hypothetical protein